MSYIVCTHEQGTEGWHLDRLGKVTGSNVSNVFAKVKSGESAGRANYRMDLVLERITGKPAESDFAKTKEMQWGNDQEPHARMAVEMQLGYEIGESGFVYLPKIMAGCSVDGWVNINGRMGIYEGKCPKSKNHYAYLMGGVAPSEYLPQMRHNMWITGAEFCLFSSFDQRMPKELQLFTAVLDRDESAIREHSIGVMEFLAGVDADEKKMRTHIENIRASKPVLETEFA
jgi:hypothetical protein